MQLNIFQLFLTYLFVGSVLFLLYLQIDLHFNVRKEKQKQVEDKGPQSPAASGSNTPRK